MATKALNAEKTKAAREALERAIRCAKSAKVIAKSAMDCAGTKDALWNRNAGKFEVACATLNDLAVIAEALS